MRILEIPHNEKLLQCGWCNTYFFVKEEEGRFTGQSIPMHKNEKVLGYAYSCPTCHNCVEERWIHESN